MEKDLLMFLLPFPIRSPIPVNSEKLEEMRRISVRCNLFPLLYRQLQKYEGVAEQQNVIREFLAAQRALFRKAVSWIMKKEETEKRITCLLSGEDIPSVVIKGTVLSRELFGESACRTPADVDILIPEDRLEEVDKAMTREGYTRGDALPLGFWKSRLHHLIYYDVPDNCVVEIHWNFGIPGFFSLDSTGIWNDVALQNGKPGLSPDMTIIMLLMHHHMHSFRELRILIDIIWAVWTYRDRISWHSFLERVRRIGLLRVLSITMEQARSVIPVEDYMKTPFAVLERELPRGRKIPIICDIFQLREFSHASNSRFMNKLILRLALDRRSAVVYSVVKIYFPSPGTLRQLYSIRKAWLLPFYYFRFIGWRLSLWKGPL